MTAPRFRRHRGRDGRRPAFAGDFGDDGRDITEVIGRPADWDGSTFEWGGASDVGLPDGGAYPAAVSPAEDYRQAIARANAGPATAPLARLRVQPPAPDMFPALPPGPPPPPPAAAQRDTGPQQRLPRYARTAARPRPRRAPDEAIFVWVPSISQHVLLCGMCLWRRHADPITANMPFTFESLRQSAWITGWRTDAFTRWCCPHCQGTRAYWSPRQVIQWDGDALDAYLAGDAHAESWHRARAERHLICDVADASHGRHAAVTR